MENEQFQERMKLLPKILGIMFTAYLLANCVATQLTAKDCNYNILLGDHLTVNGVHIYYPFKFREWKNSPQIRGNIPNIIRYNNRYYWGIILLGLFPAYLVYKGKRVLTSHGTAAYAGLDEIAKAGLAEKFGVVVGKNPFTHKLMLHYGPEHFIVVAPTRSGKGISMVIPTAIVWPHSMFVFDPKGELWVHTAWWRKEHYKQPVMKFEPLCKNDSSAKWNPLAEVDFQGICEMDNAEAIAKIMTDPGEGNSDPFWKDSAASVVKGIIIHLLYSRNKEKRPIPCPSDIISFLASPGKDKHHQFADMKCYSHITPEEFWEENGKVNVLKKIYGEYISDFSPFIKALKRGDKNNGQYFDAAMEDNAKSEKPRLIIDILREAIKERQNRDDEFNVSFDPPNFDACNTQKAILEAMNNANNESPWYMLLVHPKVAESAATIINNEAASTVSSIISSAQTPLAIYQNPLIQRNTSTSDFTIRDLLNPDQAVTLYYVCAPNDIPRLAPLTRLFVTLMFGKLTQKMKFTNAKAKKQRIVLLLDEFPQLGKLESVEHQLNICAGYGIKVVIIAQSINQINKIYTKDNGIIVGCPVSIFYAPADLETARVISERLGDKTIETQSVSTSGELFKSNVSTSQTARKLMTPEEVLRLSKDKEIVFTNGFRPVLGDKIKFFEEPYFDTRVYNPQKVEEEPKPNKLQEGIHKIFDFLGIPYSSSNDVNEAQKGVGKPIELRISDVCTPVKQFSDIALLYKAEREADDAEAASILAEKQKRAEEEKKNPSIGEQSDENTDQGDENKEPTPVPDTTETPGTPFTRDAPVEEKSEGKDVIEKEVLEIVPSKSESQKMSSHIMGTAEKKALEEFKNIGATVIDADTNDGGSHKTVSTDENNEDDPYIDYQPDFFNEAPEGASEVSYNGAGQVDQNTEKSSNGEEPRLENQNPEQVVKKARLPGLDFAIKKKAERKDVTSDGKHGSE